MHKQQVLGAAIAILMASLSIVGAQEAFRFRGIPLGITLADFRKMTYPDRDQHPDVRLICRGDRNESSIHQLEERDTSNLTRVGAIECRYYKPSIAGGLTGWAPYFAGIGNYGTSFLFTPIDAKLSEKAQLFMIRISPNSRHFGELRQTLVAGFGAPADELKSVFETRAGGKFENIKLIWRNSVSTLSLERFVDTLNGSEVIYFHNDLMQKMIDRTGEISKERVRQL
jgi:hypothetical protein